MAPSEPIALLRQIELGPAAFEFLRAFGRRFQIESPLPGKIWRLRCDSGCEQCGELAYPDDELLYDPEFANPFQSWTVRE